MLRTLFLSCLLFSFFASPTISAPLPSSWQRCRGKVRVPFSAPRELPAEKIIEMPVQMITGCSYLEKGGGAGLSLGQDVTGEGKGQKKWGCETRCLFTFETFPILFFFEMEFRCCYPDWSAMERSWLTATSTFWVQAILLPQPPE